MITDLNMKKLFTLILLAASLTGTYAQKLEKLTVEKIMRDPKWIGTSPTNIKWSDDSKKIYFDWNPENADEEGMYAITPGNLKPKNISIVEQKTISPADGNWNKKHTQKLYEKNGDIYLLNLKSGKLICLTSTTDRESNPVFSGDETQAVFLKGDNLYAINLANGQLLQLTNFVQASDKGAAKLNEQEKWLHNQQLQLFEVIKGRVRKDSIEAAQRNALRDKPLRKISLDDRKLDQLQISPDMRYVTYSLITPAGGAKKTIVPKYVTASGFTTDSINRTKVGAPLDKSQSFIYDRQRDTVYRIVVKDLPGIKDLPDYVKDYPKQLKECEKLNADRHVTLHGPYWNDDGKSAVVVIYAHDNKDRWIMRLDPFTGKLNLLDRQRDEAWIGGPGIDDESNVNGWLDNTHFYFQSEASGYSHIYVVDVNTATKTQITSGKWEVQSLQLAADKKTFYFTANMEHPGVSDYYRVPVTGGKPVKLTTMKGDNDVYLSPDEKWLAIRYSYINKPYDLYLQPNKPGAKAVQVTNSPTAEFKSYPWRAPEIFTFKNRYGTDIYARVYSPAHPLPSRPAVIFVHGAGYLQDVMYKWSSYYFREYMFNNMLADEGYTVLEIDYTGSAGYGRDMRTGIYRHMGGKDLTDHIDAVKLLVDKYGVNSKNVGIYGGSYGGFMTLMALFTAPDVFAAGAGLRSVTDWAHYNHGYTSNILNEPYTDPKAYQQSSPINFASGLKGRLLMCHGMADMNVNFQDIVRLTQKLIELHKDNWQLAPYPVEDHGFVQPSSWADEYKRVYNLFKESLNN